MKHIDPQAKDRKEHRRSISHGGSNNAPPGWMRGVWTAVTYVVPGAGVFVLLSRLPGGISLTTAHFALFMASMVLIAVLMEAVTRFIRQPH